MARTTQFDPGAVVLVRFPFTDAASAKQRPALVLSSREHQRRQRDVIVAAITSHRVDDPGPFDHVVRDWQHAGLLMPSVVRCGKIVTLERSLVRRSLGKLTEHDLDAVRGRARSALSL
jgi:mRNA interferase MazF